MSPRRDVDVVVIGARAAGAAHARLLAESGFSVLVVDRCKRGSDTVSSHTITRGGARQLARWGLLDRLVATGTPGISRSFLRFGREELALDIRSVGSGPGVICPRRWKLDAMLAQAAMEAGAEFRYETTFRDVIRDDAGGVFGVRLSDPEGRQYSVSANFIVGADGVNSPFARRVGAKETTFTTSKHMHFYGYLDVPSKDLSRNENLFAFSTDLCVGLTPTDQGLTTVIVSGDAARIGAEIDALGADKALVSLANTCLRKPVIDAPPAERTRLFPGYPTMRRQSAGPGWALIGDAGQFRDPVTAHGITDAFRDAEHLARHLAETGFDAKGYENERNAVSDPIFRLTAEMARFAGPFTALDPHFARLSKLMRMEQEWMEQRFQPLALAA